MIPRANDKVFGRASKFYMRKELGVFVTTLTVFVVVTIIEPRFLIYDNIKSILLYIPLIVVVAMGEMMVIITGNIDLSLGSILGFSGILVGQLFIRNNQFPVFPAFVLGTLTGIVLGLVNGILISKLRIPSIIVTLGTLNAFRGLLFIISGGRQIDPNYIPEKLIRLSQTSFMVVPAIILFALVIAVCAYIFMKYSHLGREIYSMGSNLKAAKLRGIHTNRVILFIYVIAGGCAGFAGIMYASRFGYVNPGMTGVGFEFTVIAATVIGGTSVSGGSGSVPGVILGCVLLGIVNTALAVLGISAFWQQAIYGIIILLALIMDKFVQIKVEKS